MEFKGYKILELHSIFLPRRYIFYIEHALLRGVLGSVTWFYSKALVFGLYSCMTVIMLYSLFVY